MDRQIWAVALVDDSTPENLEYKSYRGYVLLCDDLYELEVPSIEAGVAAYASRMGVDPQSVKRSSFAHDQYAAYDLLHTL